jgi:hypothetical protein
VMDLHVKLTFSVGFLSYADAAPLLSDLHERVAFVDAQGINPRAGFGGPGLVGVMLEFVLRASSEELVGAIAIHLADRLVSPWWGRIREHLRRIFNRTRRDDDFRQTFIRIGDTMFLFTSYRDLSQEEFDERLLRLGDHMRTLPEDALRTSPGDARRYLQWDEASRSWQKSDPPW